MAKELKEGGSAIPTNAPAAAPAAESIPSAVSAQEEKATPPARTPVAAPAAAPARVVSPDSQEIVLMATENCAPIVGVYRLNLIKDRKFRVPMWVGEHLLRTKVAVKA
jgi:hypothetical protein